MQLSPPGYLLDGTALGDSLAHIGWLAYSHLEAGPDVVTGQRLLRHALRRGFDHTFISPRELSYLVRCHSEDAAAWKEVAQSALRAGRGSAWARPVIAAADSALNVPRERRCITSGPARAV